MGGIDGGNIVRHQIYGSNSAFKPARQLTDDDRIGIRNDKGRLTEQAKELTKQIDAVLKPIFEKCIKDGLSREDFFFLVAAEAHEIILDDVIGI